MNTNEIANDDFSSQLRSLRLLLGTNYRPVSTTTLAALTNIPATAIQATEAGRRQLNDLDRKRIGVFLGALWHEQTHQWVYWKTHPLIPYSRSTYETHARALAESGILTVKDAIPLAESIHLLISSLEPKQAADVLVELHFEIERIAREHEAGPELLEAIRSNRFTLSPEPGGDEPAQKPALKPKSTTADG